MFPSHLQRAIDSTALEMMVKLDISSGRFPLNGSNANFWLHSFHALPIGSMLKSHNQLGVGARCPPCSAAYEAGTGGCQLRVLVHPTFDDHEHYIKRLPLELVINKSNRFYSQISFRVSYFNYFALSLLISFVGNTRSYFALPFSSVSLEIHDYKAKNISSSVLLEIHDNKTQIRFWLYLRLVITQHPLHHQTKSRHRRHRRR